MRQILIIVSVVLSTFIVMPPKLVNAATAAQLRQQQAQIEEQKKATEAARKKKEADAAALQSLLQKIDTNIDKTKSALTQTASDLSQTAKDLEDTNHALADSESKLSDLKIKLENLFTNLYEDNVVESPILNLLSTESLSESVQVAQYYASLDQEVDGLIKQESETRTQIATTKTKLEEQQNRLAQLKDQQAATKIGLESEQQRKNKVLADTNSAISQLKAEEAKLAARELEVNQQIQAALAQVRSGGKVAGGLNKPVKAGDIIGYQGNTGFSTGSHLHFTVLKNCDLNQAVNPSNYLGSRLSYPLSSYKITQGFGLTEFAESGAYHGAGHNGIDFQQYFGAPVHAAADGTMILKQYFGGYGNAIIIDHGDICTLYGHMS